MRKEIEGTEEFLARLDQLDLPDQKVLQENLDCLVSMDKLVQRDRPVRLVHEDFLAVQELM